MTEQEIIERFNYKATIPDDKKVHFNTIKEQGKCFALTIFRNTPPGDWQDMAIKSVHKSCTEATASLTKMKKFKFGQPVEENDDDI